MSRILLAAWPFPGHVYPNLALGRALRERGHEVAFLTGAAARPGVEAAGLEWLGFARIDEQQVTSTVATLGNLAGRPSALPRQLALWRAWLLGTISDQVADLERVADAWQPDALVCDPAMWGGILVFRERRAIPTAAFSYLAGCILPGPEGPVIGVPLPRPRAWPDRLAVGALKALLSLSSRGMTRAANRLRASYGLPPISETVTELAGQLPLYLNVGSAAFDRRRQDLPRSVHYVGTCGWEGASAEVAPEWLDGWLADRPLVYVTEGTMQNAAPRLLRATLQGLADLPVRVLATVGRHRKVESLDLGPIPANARVEAWVPHRQVFARASAVVTNGGSGTVLAALEAGLPLVVAPMAWDQPENAWRVAEAGVGLRVPIRACTALRLRAAVQHVLDDPRYRQNAAEHGRELTATGGAPRGAELVEGLVESESARAGNPARADSGAVP